MTASDKPRKQPKGQLLTAIIVLIMGLIMVPAGLLQTPLVAIAVLFGVALIALGIGALYFYNRDKRKNSEVLTE